MFVKFRASYSPQASDFLPQFPLFNWTNCPNLRLSFSGEFLQEFEHIYNYFPPKPPSNRHSFLSPNSGEAGARRSLGAGNRPCCSFTGTKLMGEVTRNELPSPEIWGPESYSTYYESHQNGEDRGDGELVEPPRGGFGGARGPPRRPSL